MNLLRKLTIALLRSTVAARHPAARLTRAAAPDDPLALFGEWYSLATEIDPEWGSAVALSTADAQGRPASRMVLLKSFDERGFVFYTNYGSRKAAELSANPHAALVFWWPETCRQLRIEGTVSRVSAAESDRYFASRPRGSKLGAWASRQSRPLARRADLEAAVAAIAERYKDRLVPRPPFWGGFRLHPATIEFWQGRTDRLHDRLRYQRRDDGGWDIERLYP